ncbi:MAG: hypothetical protein OQK78_11325, partial [Gammaproteobacteria bacterium]|nr:hypothetical protein [Gammaproteobacteria bacterium]
MSVDIFSSEEVFRAAFITGLEQMLTEHDGLGVFILVMANALIAPEIWEHLDPELHKQFDENAAYFRDTLTRGELLNATDDDIQVFLKMMVVGYKNLAPSEQH